jgi:hypothetical protein
MLAAVDVDVVLLLEPQRGVGGDSFSDGEGAQP